MGGDKKPAPEPRCATCNSVEAAHSGTCRHAFKPLPDPRLCSYNVCRRDHPHPESWPCVCQCHGKPAPEPSGRDCKHGSLARACTYCEMENVIDALRAEVERLKKALGPQEVRDDFMRVVDDYERMCTERDALAERVKTLEKALACDCGHGPQMHHKAIGPKPHPESADTYCECGCEDYTPGRSFAAAALESKP